jgi:hypothetical protein
LLWAGVAAVTVVVAVVAVLTMSARGKGPVHKLVAPEKLGAYVRRVELEKSMNLKALQQQITKGLGQTSHVVSAGYEDTAGPSGRTNPQIMLFIGGNLSGTSPSAFITSFTNQFKGAASAAAGPMGGRAVCVGAQAKVAGSVTLCTWADNDTFGVLASPSMNAAQLAAQMRTIRPTVELVTK